MTKVSISKWALEDRPREKWLSKGKRSLSNAELLSILINNGSKQFSALDIARLLMDHCDQNLEKLASLPVSELMKFKGIGKVKAIHLAASFELGLRRNFPKQDKRRIVSSKDAYDAIGYQLTELEHEEFWILLLNRANHIIKRSCISKGGVSGTVVDIKLILRELIHHLSSSIILVHNHPSGNLEPSQADIRLTENIKKAVESIDVVLLDHLIIGNSSYYSFADEGMI